MYWLLRGFVSDGRGSSAPQSAYSLARGGIEMIELPEALTIARQMTEALQGKRIASAVRGNAPHKFAFYNREPEEYAAILPGKTMGPAEGRGSCIVAAVEPGYALLLGFGGERIILHETEKTIPAKHQLLIRYDDGSALSVTVQGWGFAQLLDTEELAAHPHANGPGPLPLSAAFTLEYFLGLFDPFDPGDPTSLKLFMISKPGIRGVGNGCLQDILFRARLHPRRRAADTSAQERERLYQATRTTLQEMVEGGGRDSDRDLHNRPGGYVRLLHSKTAGEPCPECGTPIEKIAYLGGACYFCPRCQS
jgi:formamidopyrimidine-DNA glycosylase